MKNRMKAQSAGIRGGALGRVTRSRGGWRGGILAVVFAGLTVLLGVAKPVQADNLTLSAPRDPSRSSRRTYEIPASIPADCSRDVTAEINAWLRAVPDGTSARPVTLRFRKNACYRVDGTLGASYNSTDTAGFRRNFLIYDGNGATIDGSYVLPPAFTNRAGLSFRYGRALTVRNFTIKGNHPNPCNADPSQPCTIVNGGGGYDYRYEWHHGISFFASSDVAALNNRIYTVYGDGITIEPFGPEEYVIGARVEGNTIDGTGRMGVAVTARANALQIPVISASYVDELFVKIMKSLSECCNPHVSWVSQASKKPRKGTLF